MSEIAQKMIESVNAANESQNIDASQEVDTLGKQEQAIEETPELSESEVQAMDLGWKPEGRDRDNNTLSADEFLARKPLFNKIRNQGDQLAEMQKQLKELREDNKKIAKAGIKEKESLLDELRAAKESALDNLEPDEVRKIDKQIDSVRDEIAETKEGDQEVIESPYYQDFLSENKWANEEGTAMMFAAEGLAKKFLQTNKVVDGDDSKMYKFIHDEIRKEFPHKFETEKQPRGGKVASAKNRAVTQPRGKRQVTLADLPEDQREVVKVMMKATGKTEEEYLKNYEV